MRAPPLLWLILLALLWPVAARGHGGVPMTTRLLRQDQRLYLPTLYWGIFVGSDGGPWRWICDEAINGFALRDVYTGLDGTLYATDFPGLWLSRDGGCSFDPVTGPVASLLVNALVADPAPGPGSRRVWLSGTGEGITGAIYRSDDAGQTFSPVHPQDPAQDPSPYLMRGLVLAQDGRFHALVDEGPQQDQPVVYTSRDQGHSFARSAVAVPAGVYGGRSRLLAADPRDSAVVYVHLQGDSDQVLLRVDTAQAQSRELLRTPAYIFAVTVAGERLLAATGQGVYFADGPAPLQHSDGLHHAQCLDVRGADLYACAWEYGLDQSSLARSADGGRSFQPVFRVGQTAGVLACPAGTPVAQRCPDVWQSYAAQLGIDVSAPTVAAPPTPPPAGCQVPIGAPPGPAAPLALALLCLPLARRLLTNHPGSGRWARAFSRVLCMIRPP